MFLEHSEIIDNNCHVESLEEIKTRITLREFFRTSAEDAFVNKGGKYLCI